MSFESTDSLSRSSRAGASRSNIGGSVGSSRPFLNLLNPMGRAHRGYQRIAEAAVEEEDDEDGADDRHTSLAASSRSPRQRAESHELRQTSPTPFLDEGGDTEPEEDNDVPQSFFLESAGRKPSRPSSSSSRRAMKQSKRSRRPASGATPSSDRLSKPPRPSEIDGPSVLDSDQAGTSTAYATTRPQRGLTPQQQALWNWVNVYNLDAYLQEVIALGTSRG